MLHTHTHTRRGVRNAVWRRAQLVSQTLLIPLQEEGLRKGGEPKYAHLSMELHVFIEVFAPVPEAYLRMAHAMEEVKKFLFPVSVTSIQAASRSGPAGAAPSTSHHPPPICLC